MCRFRMHGVKAHDAELWIMNEPRADVLLHCRMHLTMSAIG